MKKLLIKVMLFFVFIKCWLEYNSPYGQAKLHMAYRIYQDTVMYKEREKVKIFGPNYPLIAFKQNMEAGYFLRKLKWSDKLKAFFIPYSYIG